MSSPFKHYNHEHIHKLVICCHRDGGGVYLKSNINWTIQSVVDSTTHSFIGWVCILAQSYTWPFHQWWV